MREKEVVMMDEKVLQHQIQEFTRRFGLLTQDITPCNYPLSPSQAHALQVLGQSEHITLQMLATQLHLDKSTVSRLVTQLVEYGLVWRTVNQENRREIHIALSERGHVVLDELLVAVEAKFHLLWTRLSQEKGPQIIEALALLNEVLWEE